MIGFALRSVVTLGSRMTCFAFYDNHNYEAFVFLLPLLSTSSTTISSSNTNLRSLTEPHQIQETVLVISSVRSTRRRHCDSKDRGILKRERRTCVFVILD